MELQTSLGHTITVEHAAWEDGKPRIALRTFDSLNDLTWILKLHEATQLAMFLEAAVFDAQLEAEEATR